MQDQAALSASTPSSAFSCFAFDKYLEAAIKRAGYTEPTPIQKQAIPVVLSGKDVLGLAQTGTGKTAAFALPILQKLLPNHSRLPRVLVVVPTRELASQVASVFRAMSFGSPLKIAEIFGGVGFDRQIQELRAGVDVVVACPGRLLDLIERRAIVLTGVQTLVLDEADQMFDMGFLPTIRRVLRVLPQKRQNLLFSATMPRELRGLAMEVLRSPQTVEVSRGEAAVTITHSIYEVQQEQKVSLLQHLLSTIPSDSVLVFTRTKHRAKRLAQQLKALGRSVTSLQGNLTQGQRVRAMEGFRSGDYQIMVATDIAARGIDVSSVSHVINFDIPDTVDAYVHRIGRTGRAAKDGDAFTFVTREDLGMLRDIERRMGGKLQRGKIPENLPFVAPPQREGGERRERPQRGGGQGQRQGRSRNQGQGQSEGYGQGSGQSRSQRSEYNRNWRGGSNQQQSPGGQSRRRNSGRNFDNRATRV